MKGLILAGGAGTRLYPVTPAVSKQMLPIYDKPMLYYPLATLMQAGIRDILFISTSEDLPRFKLMLGDGSAFGIRLTYCVQPSPDGLAQAFVLGEDFLGNDACVLILGDNIFHGNGLEARMRIAAENAKEGIATLFCRSVSDPERYGIASIDENGSVTSLEEKPAQPKSHYAVTGMYYYPAGVTKKAKQVKPSRRGELEITSLNELYLQEHRLAVQFLGEGFEWFDTGTFESLYEACVFIRNRQERHQTEIAALEAIAYQNGWISKNQLLEAAKQYKASSYGKYLRRVAENDPVKREAVIQQEEQFRQKACDSCE